MQLGITVHKFSEWLRPDDRAEAKRIANAIPASEIPAFMLDGLVIGEHAYAGALRFFATGALDDEPMAEPILEAYLESALRMAFATRRLLRVDPVLVGGLHARHLRAVGYRG